MIGLFRREALDANQPHWLGEIIILQPPSARLVSMLTAFVVTALILLLWLGEYTRRTTVSGKLAPAAGLVQVYANQAGTVLEKRFTEGELLAAGQVMYVISSERQSAAAADVQLSISRELATRRELVEQELRDQQRVLHDQQRRTAQAIERLESELKQADDQIAGQVQRVGLENASSKRYQDLFEKGYVSSELLQDKQRGLLEQNNRLAALQRDRLALVRNIHEKQDELAGIEARSRGEAAALQRQLSQNRQDWSANELRRSEVIVAPRAGIATAIAMEAGQSVAAGAALASIVPEGSRLQARLYAPSKAVGFIARGDQVLLRYESFPYQRFGLAAGRVQSVSQAPLQTPDASVAGGDAASLGAQYEIVVELERQSMPVNGKEKPLPAGMLLEADILSETRRLYQWLFVPFQTLNAMRGTD